MALAGLHVACGHFDVKEGAALLGTLAWSQTLTGALATTQTTTQFASEPGSKPASFDGAFLAFRITSSLDAWVAIGSSAPDPTQASGTRANSSARVLVRAGTTELFFCRNGDYLAAIAA